MQISIEIFLRSTSVGNVLFWYRQKRTKKAPTARCRRLIPLAAAASGYKPETGTYHFYIFYITGTNRQNSCPESHFWFAVFTRNINPWTDTPART